MVHSISGIQMFPSNNLINTPIDQLPVLVQSAAYIATLLGEASGCQFNMSNVSDGNHGIPFNIVTNATPTFVPTLTFPATSYTGAFPVPASPLIESDSTDHHLICLNTDTGAIYEMEGAVFNGTTLTGTSAWKWDTTINAMPAVGSTTADAAGLPMLPGLLTYDEINSGLVNHALYLIVPVPSGNGLIPTYIWPAVHGDGSNIAAPAEGMRLRLTSAFNISGFSAFNQVILTALKKYGCIIMDKGAANSIKFQGVPDSRWSSTDRNALNAALSAANFEVVDQSQIQVSPTSLQAGPITIPLQDGYDGMILSLQPQPSCYLPCSDQIVSVAYDATINGNNGAYNGGISLGQKIGLQGMYDTCALGDGTSGYIALPPSFDPTGLTKFSFAFWMNLIDDANFTTPLGNFHSGGHSGFDCYINTPDETIHVQVGNGTTFVDFGSVHTTTFGIWQMIAFTGDSTAMRLYINGALDATGPAMPTMLAATTPIAFMWAIEAGNHGWVHGRVAKCALYFGALLTAAQIRQMYIAGMVGFNPGIGAGGAVYVGQGGNPAGSLGVPQPQGSGNFYSGTTGSF